MNSSSHHYIHWFQRDIAASSATNWWVIDIQRYSSKNLHGKWKSSEPKLHEFGFQQVAFECVKLSFWETRPKDPDTRSPWLDRGWWDIPDYTGPGHMIYRFIYIYISSIWRCPISRCLPGAKAAKAAADPKSEPKGPGPSHRRRLLRRRVEQLCPILVRFYGKLYDPSKDLLLLIWTASFGDDCIRQIYTPFWGFCHFLKYWRMSSCFRCWKILLDRKLPCFVWWFTSW